MKIEHVAPWTKDIEKMKLFYEKYFNGKSGEKYTNTSKKYCSYFLCFESGARLELMQKEGISEFKKEIMEEFIGISHIAFKVNSEKEVDELTNILSDNRYTIMGNPRKTGDGYYESVILDPDGNRVEIVY